MNLSTFLAIFTTLIFGVLAVYMSVKADRATKKGQGVNTTEETIKNLQHDTVRIIIHELRAPLSAIKGAAALMVATKLSEEEREKLIHMIYQQSQLLLDQVSSLLEAAKLDAGKFDIQKMPSDLSKILREKVELFTPQAQVHHVTLSSSIPELPTISLDPGRIGQVLNNLISNSLKYTPDGGTITISAKHEQNLIIVSITDTGPGISEQKQKSLFSKFSTAGTQESGVDGQQRFDGGTGLGLFIAKGIVEAHGGTITVSSKEGSGTTFSFQLPTS